METDVHVGVRTWWVEKVPGHGVGRAEELAGRPARRPKVREMILEFIFELVSFRYPSILYLKSLIGRF